jgi:hypothetical protein
VGFGAGAPHRRAVVGAIFIALTATRLASQSTIAPAQRDGVTSELAARIAAAIAPSTQVSLEVPADEATLQNEIVSSLAMLGVRVVGAADDVPLARASCRDNLRERACSLDVSAAARTTVIVTRPLEPVSREADPGVALELRPVLSQQARILDLVRTSDGVLVLSPTAVVQYKRMDGGWRTADSRPVPRTRPWPRDVRGRLRVAAGGVDAFLPGVTCAGSTDPLTISCSERVAPWPLDIENVALDPARNYFRSSDGQAFYGIARLGDAAGARWLAATLDHTLAFVDDSGQSSATTVGADDVVAVRARCRAEPYVVVSSPDRGRDADRLTLFEVTRRRLTAAASPMTLTGKITALWPSPDREGATVITYDRDAGRYDAHEIVVSCPG